MLRYAARLERLSLKMNLGNLRIPTTYYVFAHKSFTELFNTPLPCLVTLRSLNLELDIQGGPSHQSLPPFRSLFDNMLEDVEIGMELMDCQNWAVVVRDWLLLATVFTKTAFHCLKIVTVSTFIDVDDEDIAAEMAKIPFGRLKLHYDFPPTPHHNDESLQIECKKSVLIAIIMHVPLELTMLYVIFWQKKMTSGH